MRFEEYHSQQQVVHQEASDSISCNHPIVASDVDICSLADNIASSATLKQSRIQDYDIKELKDILHQIGATVSAQRVSRKMIATAIITHVNTKCSDCKNTLVQF